MIKATAYYTPPTDPSAFDEHYAAVHVPLARRLPGLVRFESGKVLATADGSPAPYHRTADLYFEDMDAAGAAFTSDIGVETGRDARELAERTGSQFSLTFTAVDPS